MEMGITFGGGKKVGASYKGFTFATDQPAECGGEETAPEPLDLFFVSIATCTAYTMLSFCQSREIETEGMKIRVKLQTAGDGERVTKVRHELRLPEGFPEKYVKAMVRVAATCSVKRYLNNPPEVETVVVS
jgi:putative redox protein